MRFLKHPAVLALFALCLFASAWVTFSKLVLNRERNHLALYGLTPELLKLRGIYVRWDSKGPAWAAAELRKLLKSYPKNPEINYYLAVALQQAGSPDKQEVLSLATKADVRGADPETRVQAAQMELALLGGQDSTKSARIISELVEAARQENWRAPLASAVRELEWSNQLTSLLCIRSNHELPAVMKETDKWLSEHPDYQVGRFRYGLFLKQQRQVAEAMRQWRALVEAQPSDALLLQCHIQLGLAAREQGDAAAAKSYGQSARADLTRLRYKDLGLEKLISDLAGEKQ